MLTFKPKYLIACLVLLLTEIIIAAYVHDKIIRPYIGDLLVVILIYCFIMTFFLLPVMPVAIAVLLFAFGIETLQYFNLLHALGLEKSVAAHMLLGSSFQWLDMLMYCLGFLLSY